MPRTSGVVINDQLPVHARFDGPIVMIGFGSIGRGTLPLLERHIQFDRSKFVVIDPVDTHRGFWTSASSVHQVALTRTNFREVLTPLLTGGPGRGMIVNVSVDTSSADLMAFCQEIDCHYIDNVAEPWPGSTMTRRSRCRSDRIMPCASACSTSAGKRPGGVTMVNCCGANPGMVSWFVKQALLDVARDTGISVPEPNTRENWAG